MAQLNSGRSSELAVKENFRFLYSFYCRPCLKPGPFRIDSRHFCASSEKKDKDSLGNKKKSNLFN